MINGKFLNKPKFVTTNNYVNEYFDLVNDYYSQWNLNTIKVSYYNLDIENSVIDKEKLNSGSYEMVGEKSGWRWRKILQFPLGNISQPNLTPTNDERGTTISDRLMDAVFPRSNGIVPKVHDFISFDQFNTETNFMLKDPPLYEVINIEKSNDFELSFYKINLKISYVTKSAIDMQLHDILNFVDYEKRIYNLDASIVLEKLLEEKGENKLKGLFDQKSGLYAETIILDS